MPKKANEKKNKEILEKEPTIDVKSIEIELNNYLEDRKVDIIKELLAKIDEQVELKVSKRLKEEEKKLVRGKTAKIIRRDIIIIILLALVGYFGYCLYDIDYFNIRTKVVDKPINKEEPKDDNKDKQTDKDNEKDPLDKDEENKEPVVDNKPDSAYYIENYSYLLDNLLIDDEEAFNLFSKSVTKENISNEMMLKIAYKNIDKVLITKDKDMITFHKDSLLESAKKIFGENIALKNEMFSYGNIKFMYYNEAYIGLKENDVKASLLYKITEAKEEDNKLTFDIIIAKLDEENNLLDKENNILIENYNNEEIDKYKDKLSTIKVSFEKANDNYIFSSIEA